MLDNKNLAVFRLGGFELWITESIRNTWVIMGILIIFAVIVRLKLKNFKSIPKGFQNVAEALIETFDNFAKSTLNPKLMFLGNWFFMVFAFILLSNLLGLMPFVGGLRPPTADWSVTFTFAFCTFVLIQAMGIKFRKGAYIKSLFEPNFIFFPLNIIGELARPVSLSFRLFGNIVSGMILSTLLYQLAPWVVLFGPPLIVHGFFDIFAGSLQAFIFCVLSLSFINVTAEGPS